MSAMRSLVSSGVTAGDSETPMPRSRAPAMSPSRSKRRIGSPPVMMTCGMGLPKSATWSRMRSASSWVSSPGGGSSWALARQWRQARAQAVVSSQ